MSISFKNILLISATLLASIGCSKNMMDQPSGFLKSYKGLESDGYSKHSRSSVVSDVNLEKYDTIIIKKVKILSGEKIHTSHNKKLLEEASVYLTKGYKKIFQEDKRFTVVDNPLENTALLEIAVSTVKIEYDNLEVYQYIPIALALQMTERATYKDPHVKLLTEARISDAHTHKVLGRFLSIGEGLEVSGHIQSLTFKEIKPALDSWLKGTKERLKSREDEFFKHKAKQ